MKNTKTIYLWILLLLVVGIIGCSSSGGSSSGGSTTPTTPTSPLVGTWKYTDNPGYTLTFNADGTGSISDGHTISSWTLTSANILNMSLPQAETFQLTWSNEAKTGFCLHNLSPSDETLCYTK